MSDEMKTIRSSTDIVFLLGAGASVQCGVPEMKRMAETFKESLRNNPRYTDIIDAIQQSDRRIAELGIEPLLEKIHLLALLSEGGNPEIIKKVFRLHEEIYPFETLEDLKERIVNFLLISCSAFNEDITHELYGSFLDLRKEVDPPQIHIFSLNYDICIESTCRAYSIKCSTGFEGEESVWTGDFVGPVNLYKLHGSVSWRGHEMELIELPIPAPGGPMAIGESEYEMVVLYPMITRHRPYVYPYSDLIGIFEEKLSKTQVLAVIGYSLRDHHIEHIIQKAMKKNENLEVWLFSPHASERKNSKFQGYGSWPRNFEDRFYAIDTSFDGIVDILRKRYRIREEICKNLHTDRGEAYKELGMLWKAYGNYEEAIRCAKKSLKISRDSPGIRREALSVLMHTYDAMEKDKDREEIARKVLRAYRRVDEEEMNEYDLFTLGKAYCIVGNRSMAEEYLVRALEAYKAKSLAMFRKCYGEIIECLGRDAAVRLIRVRGSELALEAQDYREYAKVRQGIADQLKREGKPIESRKIHEEDIETYQSILEEKQNPVVWENLGEAYYAVGRKKKAVPCFKKAASMYKEQKRFVDEKRMRRRISAVEDEIRWATD